MTTATRVQKRARRPGVIRRAWRGRKSPKGVLFLAGVGVLGVLTMLGLGIFDRDRADTAENTLQTVADPLATLCRQDPTIRARVGDDVCFTAQGVVATPKDGENGMDGVDGLPGRGIVGTVIREDGHMVVSYTDGSRIDLGLVVGRQGTPGAAGVGVATAELRDGRLVLTMTDGAVRDVGPVVGQAGADGADGAAGRGIAGTAIVDGRLVVSYTDGSTEDAGPVPAGSDGTDGKAGRDGSPAASFTFTDAVGVRQSCTRVGGPDTAPDYDCAAQ